MKPVHALAFFVSLYLFLLLTGCSKQPVVPKVPNPMTEQYLLDHMNITYDASRLLRTIFPLPIQSTGSVCKEVIHTRLILSAQQDLTAQKSTHAMKNTDFLLLFSIESGKWNAFSYAIDSDGHHHPLTPYTSYIRDGKYTENFYLQSDKVWVENIAKHNETLLLIGQDCEILIDIDHVYAAALLDFLESSSYDQKITETDKSIN